jgi:Ras-related protein Rap-1A
MYGYSDMLLFAGVPLYETSAKKNWHVTDAFEDLLRQMRARYPAVPRKKKRDKTRTGEPSGRHESHGHVHRASDAFGGADGRETEKPDKCIIM